MTKPARTRLTVVADAPANGGKADALSKAIAQIDGAHAIVDALYTPLSCTSGEDAEIILETLGTSTLINTLHVVLERLESTKELVESLFSKEASHG